EPNEFVGLSEVRFVGAELGTLGDFNTDGQLTVDDINLLNAAIRAGGANSVFDVTTDGNVDEHDRDYWVNELKRTWYGDANLDGVFDTTDFVEVFQAGQYEDGLDKNSLWQTGDWNGDGEFDSGDFVTAFQGGGFEQGPRAAVAAVPEPSSCVLFLLGSAAIRRRCRVATKVVNRGSQSG
ncbi:MAG: PEP-CTERM sorting domain-containing protein, partial [Planctomycetales bacterium]|nr:PEP-CTERM sorting domain-containing protein [Planctomycetales bacterium]